MDATSLARLQFAATSSYHFLFVPLTLGLGLIVAILETIHYRTRIDAYKDMAIFWARLFAINFAMGVATGIVMEFQFGMNWSEYSRFVGDIFGIPLAIEALLAFFMESTFLGVYLFGRDKLPRAVHLASAWLVIIGATISSLWILIANSWMNEPVGYVLRNGRAEMTDFFAAVLSPHVQAQFPHVVIGGWIAGGLFVVGVSAWHILRKHRLDLFVPSMRIGLLLTAVASIASATTGHEQAQHVAKTQPMKLAAMEALWDTEKPASFSIFSAIDQKNNTSYREWRIPTLLSVLGFNNTTSEVRGINDLQSEAVARYGEGNYIPPVAETYWSFRIMVGLGMIFILTSLWGLWLWWRGSLEKATGFLRFTQVALFLPFVAIITGWWVTEIGRQPWIVQGLMLTKDGVSPNVAPAAIVLTLVGFSLLYIALIVVDVYLLRKYARMGADGRPSPKEVKNLGGGVHAY